MTCRTYVRTRVRACLSLQETLMPGQARGTGFQRRLLEHQRMKTFLKLAGRGLCHSGVRRSLV